MRIRCPLYRSLWCSLLFTASTLSWALGEKQQQQLRSLQDSSVVRTDYVRLVPFQVQIAIQDETSEEDAKLISETLYQSGTILTDTITDWMTASFVTKSSGQAGDLLGISNQTAFDSIALQLLEKETSQGSIDGQELNLVQISLEGISLWERQGSGTPPMEAEIIELMQRATFLEERKLKEDLQRTITNLLYDLGVDDGDDTDGDNSVTVVDVRAYITPPGSINNDDATKNSVGDSSAVNTATDDKTNQNLEIIIIVAIVVAVLAFFLLVFAVVWAWRSDKNDKTDTGKSVGSRRSVEKKKRNYEVVANGSTVSKEAPRKPSATNAKSRKPDKPRSKKTEASAIPPSASNGSYPKVVGDTSGAVSGLDTDDDDTAGNNTNGTPNPYNYPDSVVSSDISTSLTAYYKSGMGGSFHNNGSNAHKKDFNDAASMSSMDSYGYSLDGYAPSLGPTQGGYPVGPLHSARDAPIPLGNSQDETNVENTIHQLQEDESIVDYDA